MLVPADAAAQLVQIGQAVLIGIVDEDGVGVGNVQAAFDDRRGQQDVELVLDEIEHHLFQLPFAHLAVADADARFGHDLLQSPGNFFDVVYAIVNEERLTVAVQFAHDGMANQILVEAYDLRFHGQPLGGRRFQIRYVA